MYGKGRYILDVAFFVVDVESSRKADCRHICWCRIGVYVFAGSPCARRNNLTRKRSRSRFWFAYFADVILFKRRYRYKIGSTTNCMTSWFVNFSGFGVENVLGVHWDNSQSHKEHDRDKTTTRRLADFPLPPGPRERNPRTSGQSLFCTGNTSEPLP